MKATRNSLLVSGLSLVLSVAILMGATFAWFTDSVTNSGNTIQAGELEVSFQYKSLTGTDYTDVPTAAGDMGKLFANQLWEPGYSNGLDLKVSNNGTLALKWQLYFTNVKSTDGQNGAELADVLDVYVIGVNDTDLSGQMPVSTLSGLSGGLVNSGTLSAETNSAETEFSVVLKMQEDAGNDYQNAKVTFDVELRATQAASEADGFGNTQYDAAANGNPDQEWSNGGSVTVTVVEGQATILSVPGVKLVVPADTVENDTELTLDVTPIEPPADVPVEDGQSALSYDITVSGLSADNKTPIPVEMYIGKGLKNVTLYHGTELIPSQYNPDTGYITFASTSFSPFTVVYSLFEGGTGADEDAYLIGTAAQLKAFRDSVNAGNSYQGKTIKLTASIDLGGGEWEPIGTGTSFQGVFDGGGYTVSNYKVTKTAENAGLFGTLVSPGVIQNITVADVTVSAASGAGALIGNSFTGWLKGCSVAGTIQITANYKAGGLSGGGYARITDCHVNTESGSSVTGVYQAANLEGDNVGGLIGFVGEGSITITDSSVSGLTVAGTRKVGGLAGSVFTNNVISGCTVEAVTVSSNATAEYVAGNSASIGIGGVVGVYTANGEGDGSLNGCTVKDVTLSGLEGVYKGYLVGGMRGSLPNFPASPWTQSGNQLLGTNTGSNSPVDETVTNGAYPATVVAT